MITLFEATRVAFWYISFDDFHSVFMAIVIRSVSLEGIDWNNLSIRQYFAFKFSWLVGSISPQRLPSSTAFLIQIFGFKYPSMRSTYFPAEGFAFLGRFPFAPTYLLLSAQTLETLRLWWYTNVTGCVTGSFGDPLVCSARGGGASLAILVLLFPVVHTIRIFDADCAAGTLYPVSAFIRHALSRDMCSISRRACTPYLAVRLHYRSALQLFSAEASIVWDLPRGSVKPGLLGEQLIYPSRCAMSREIAWH